MKLASPPAFASSCASQHYDLCVALAPLASVFSAEVCFAHLGVEVLGERRAALCVLVLEGRAMKFSRTVSFVAAGHTERIRTSTNDTISHRAFGQARMIDIRCRERAGVFRRRYHGW